MSRNLIVFLVLATVAASVVTWQSRAWEEPVIPEDPAEPASLVCWRSGGEPSYCRCLDRFEAARETAGLPEPGMPPMGHETIRYAMQRPQLYPIITGDTPRCIKTPAEPSGLGDQS